MEPPPNVGAGDIFSYSCRPATLRRTIGDTLSDPSVYDNPATVYTMAGWATAAASFTELANFTSVLKNAVQAATTDPQVSLRDASKGATMRWCPPSDSYFAFQDGPRLDQRLPCWPMSAMRNCTMPVVPPGVPVTGRDAFVHDPLAAYVTAFTGGDGAIVAAQTFPFGSSVSHPAFVSIANSAGASLAGLMMANEDDQLTIYTGGGMSTGDVENWLSQEATPEDVDAIDFGNVSALVLANLPAGAYITMQLVWHLEVQTDVASSLNANASPQILDAGWQQLWAMLSDRSIWPVAVSGHSFLS